MRKISDFKFGEDGMIIIFMPTSDSLVKDRTYIFSVEDNKDLTEKLRESFTTVAVVERYISTRARAIFELIKSPKLVPFPSEEGLALLIENFRERFGIFPAFKFENISKNRAPSWRSSIINIKMVFEPGIGRNKIESKVKTLENLFKSL